MAAPVGRDRQAYVFRPGYVCSLEFQAATRHHQSATGAVGEITTTRTGNYRHQRREQQRIGRDLHDGVCQYLAAIGFTASMLRQKLEKESSSLAESAGEIVNLLQDAAVRTRDFARGLSPVDRDEGGLESALEELAASTSRLAGISCSF